MKIKTLKDLSGNFETLSHSEEKETLGGAFLTSTADGHLYDIDTLATTMGHVNYFPNTNTAFMDSDPNIFGGSFSYSIVDDGSGTPVTINVNEGQWDVDRFSLLYIDTNNGNAFGDRVYLDNLTGNSFNCTGEFLKNILPGSGYEYESLPDISIADDDGMGAFSGYTSFHLQLEKYIVYDELTGGYYDYSRILTNATHHDADYEGMFQAGYQQQSIDLQIARDNYSRANANDMTTMMNYLNGSKLAAAQKVWKDDPANHGVDFDYGAYVKSNQQVPVLNLGFGYAGSFALKDFYYYLKDQLEQFGMNNVHTYFI